MCHYSLLINVIIVPLQLSSEEVSIVLAEVGVAEVGVAEVGVAEMGGYILIVIIILLANEIIQYS